MYLQEPERPHELGRPLGHPIFTLLAGFRRIIYPIKIRILREFGFRVLGFGFTVQPKPKTPKL